MYCLKTRHCVVVGNKVFFGNVGITNEHSTLWECLIDKWGYYPDAADVDH
jgi:hypothetical protein